MAMAADTTAISFRKMIAESSISRAEQMITKWDPDTTGSPYADVSSIFLESRDEARRYLFAVHDLHKAMERSSAGEDSPIRLRRHLVDVAMRRLQREFAEILSYNRDVSPVSLLQPAVVDGSFTFRSHLLDYSSDGEDSSSSSFQTAALDYLRAVAECMISSSSGYAEKCVEIYKQSRRSVVEDGLSRLWVEHVNPSHVQKLNWESLDFRVMQWIAATRPVFGEIFTRERILCDAVFPSEAVADKCFAEITRDAAVQFFRFPHVVASKSKRPPEKILHYLNMYRSIRDLSAEIEAAFSSKSTNMVQSQVDASLLKLSSVVKRMLADFESTVSKDTSKSMPPNGGLHPLTRSVMSYLVPLADHANVLAELYADDPLPSYMEPPPIPKPGKVSKAKRLESIEEEEEEEEVPEKDGATKGSSATSRFMWLITTLLCKLDLKAELYKEASQSYLFLANNAQYVVNKAKESDELKQLLGQEWLSSHEKKARSFARSFLKLAWKSVLETVPDDGSALPDVDARRQRMVQFNRVFEEACKSHSNLVVLDEHVRNEIKSAISRNLVGRYGPFYERCRTELRTEDGLPAVRFAPEDLLNHLSGLYCENSGSFDCWWSSWSGPPHGSGSGKASRWRWLRESR